MSDAGYYCVWLKGPWANAPLNNVRIGLSPLRPFKAGDVNSINNFTGQLRLIKR